VAWVSLRLAFGAFNMSDSRMATYYQRPHKQHFICVRNNTRIVRILFNSCHPTVHPTQPVKISPLFSIVAELLTSSQRCNDADRVDLPPLLPLPAIAMGTRPSPTWRKHPRQNNGLQRRLVSKCVRPSNDHQKWDVNLYS
jgi:hypothetical protein